MEGSYCMHCHVDVKEGTGIKGVSSNGPSNGKEIWICTNCVIVRQAEGLPLFAEDKNPQD